MSETYLKLGSIGAVTGVFAAFVGMIWSFFSYKSYSTMGVIYNFMWSYFPVWSARHLDSALQESISVVSELFVSWTVATYALFMVFGILTGIGLYGIRSLKIHKMEVVSLVTGSVVAPPMFIFGNLGGNPFYRWIALMIVFVVFGSTLIVTGEATGRPEAAKTSGKISIVVGIASFFVLGLPPTFMIVSGNDLVMLSPMIVFALFAIISVMMTIVFRSAQRGLKVKPAAKGEEKPSVTITPPRDVVKEKQAEKVVVCPFCGVSVSKKEKKCPECGGVLL